MSGVLILSIIYAPGIAVAALAPPAAARERSLPVTVAGTNKQAPDPATARALRQPSKVVWPGAGSAVVDLTAARAKAALVGENAEQLKAGTLPVSVSSAAPARLRVDMLGRRGDDLLVRLHRLDGAAKNVSLQVDYSGFRDAYGGDWASRLRLVALPECALTTPDACQGTPVSTFNNGSGTLRGNVASTGLFAVAAAAAGTSGNFGESALSPSSTWSAGGPSGDFSWSYPLTVPPAVNGPSPELAFGYSSGNVDGRTTGTNNQPSWVGEGFEFTPGGFIERRYAPCASDMKNGNNSTRKTGDLCWGTDNLTYSVNGRGGELVRDDTTGEWHPRIDDGSRVERFRNTAQENGDNDGEYWRITTRDGTQLHFGLNKLPGWASGNAKTNSTWTVPVYGNHSGEPCYQTAFDTSFCQQAWRWNLDHIIDVRGNTMSYFYDVETNNYARNITSTKVSTYTRAGYVKSIEYGQRAGEVYTKPWTGKVLFTVADRCLPNTTCATSSPGNWPDVPLDQLCTSTTNCGTKYSPTFWTQKRLSKVNTQVWNGSARDVDSWTLNQAYPSPGDGTNARLWLSSIQRTGLVGGTLALPAVTFTGVQMNNRVDGADHIPAMNWWRMQAIRQEGGSEIRVTYSPKDCAYQTNLPVPATNGKRCHPVRWTPPGQSELTDWFNKYVVTEVSETDLTAGLEPEITAIEYVGPAAWRHDEEDGLVPESRKTWGQWRGYEKLRVRKGRPTETRSLTEVTYFRGMDGDKTATAGQVKDIKVIDSTGAAWDDTDQFTGSTRETVVYTGDGGTVLSRSISDPWLSPPSATRVRPWGTTKAYQVQESRVAQGETISGVWRQTASNHSYGSDGTLLEHADFGDLATTSDDRCTKYTYARNTSAWLLELPSQKQTIAGSCTTAPTSASDVVEDERYYYDGSTTLGAAPVKGDVTKREEISGWSGSAATYVTTFRATYDVHGRMREQFDVSSQRKTFDYTPTTGAAPTKLVATNPLGHVTTYNFEPAWGAELSAIAPNGRKAEAVYDPIGRVLKTWLAGRDRATQTPNAEYQYVLRNDGPNLVVGKTLEADGGYRTEYKLFDGKMRLRQTQIPSPRGGRIITDNVLDARGRLVKENGPYYNEAPPGPDLVIPQENMLPAQKVTSYDGADRVLTEVFKVEGVEQWRTTHTYEVDRQHTTPPLGDTPTTRILDGQGRLTELRQYKGTTASGAYDATKYTYTKRGQMETVTDAANNVWRFFYDARGRKIRTEDPDQGATDYTLGDANEVLTQRDALGNTLAFEYDVLGRRIATHKDSVTGPKLAEWTFDRLPDGTAVPGLAVSSTRWVGANAYTTTVLEYDSANRVTKQELSIPASEGALAGKYVSTNTYRQDGELDTTTLPGVGGLPQETLRYGYNAVGLPTTVSGLSNYVTGTNYTEYGEEEQVTFNTGTKWLSRTFQYELGTRRLKRADTRRETSPQLIGAVSYQYDAVGNVTRISDAPDPALGEGVDTQCFKQDSLRRLTDAWTPTSGDCNAAPSGTGLGGPAAYWHKWTFDALGNRLSETRTAAGGAATTSTYAYYTAQPHALKSVTKGSTVDNYTYDANGNMLTRTKSGVGQSLVWDREGRLTSLTEGGRTASYVYDAQGDRLISRDANGATLYLGGTQLRLEGTALTGTRYYQHNGRTIAMRKGAATKVSWLISDHHGTAETSVDSDTQAIVRQRRDPYGGVRGPGTPNLAGTKGFVGGIADDTGLTHLGAREYEASTGRFISTDPVVDFEDPQQLHGYAYANNSPVSFSDADGQKYITKQVTSYKTVYRMVVRKKVETVRQLVTQYLRLVSLILALIFGTWFVSKVVEVIKHIVRYIKVLEKRLIKITKLIRIYQNTTDPKKRLQLMNSFDPGDFAYEVGKWSANVAWTAVTESLRLSWKLTTIVWNESLKGLQEVQGLVSKISPFKKLQSKLVGAYVEVGAWVTGGECRTVEGMRVCHTQMSLFYGGSGTTYGDTFLTGYRMPDKDLMEHEKVHRDQWRKYGTHFAGMYLMEQLRVLFNGSCNQYEIKADLSKGGYSPCK